MGARLQRPRLCQRRPEKLEVPHGNGAGMHGAFAMNLRRPLFTDRRVRQALVLAFDFDLGPTASCFTASTPAATVISAIASWRALPGADAGLAQPLKTKLDPPYSAWPSTRPKPDALSLRANLRQAQNCWPTPAGAWATMAGWSTPPASGGWNSSFSPTPAL